MSQEELEYSTLRSTGYPVIRGTYWVLVMSAMFTEWSSGKGVAITLRQMQSKCSKFLLHLSIIEETRMIQYENSKSRNVHAGNKEN